MTTPSTPNRHLVPRATRIAIRVGVTGLVLGIVVVGAGALLNRQAPVPALTGESTTSVRPVQPGEADYTAGLAALASGETTKATALITKAAAAGNTSAQSKLAEISRAVEPTATPAPAPAAPDVYLKAVRDIGSLLPTSVAGYDAGVVETSTASAILSLEPTKSGPLGKARIVVLTVLDKRSAAGAKAYVAAFPKAYGKDLGSATIGSIAGRFGTDGSHLAAVTFSRGRFAFEVVVTVTRGAPRDLRSVTLQAASAFAATRTTP